MRIFATVLILILSVQCWTKADEIGDYEIEGMTIGDSLLNYISLNDIKIAEEKMEDMNAFTVEQAMEQVEGSCRSMSISVKK